MPDSYVRHDVGGIDWGLTVLHPSKTGAWRWPTLASEGSVTAVSLGVPVGLEVASGPLGLARRLLDGQDIHSGVVPPFGLLALDSDQRFAIQQDWLGMSRLFTGQRDGVTVFGSRPSMVAEFLDGSVAPDYDGWASYATCGHFGASLSPVRGVRLLHAGERVTGRHLPDGGWALGSEIRYDVDDVVRAGIDARGDKPEDALDAATAGFANTAATISNLYAEEITLGLSGGKDSRVIAASFIAAGTVPAFATNEDTAAEGVTARHLVQILRDNRGIDPVHKLFRAGSSATVLTLGLRERIARLQRRHDYQFPSTYTIRPAGSPLLEEVSRPLSLTGAGGELAVGYWYPTKPGGDDLDRSTAMQAALSKLLPPAHSAMVTEAVLSEQHDRISGVVDHAEDLGLHGLEVIDYLYLVERVRRWYTSAYVVGMVTPFLSPAFVSASFALSPEQKRQRVLHTGLLERLTPEWADIPFVSVDTGPSTATRVKEGDGIPAICELLDTTDGALLTLLRRDVVERTVTETALARGNNTQQKILQQFAWMAAASHHLEPDSVRPPTGVTYAAITRSPVPGPQPSLPRPPPRWAPLAARWKFVKRSPLGLTVWNALRSSLIRRRARRLSTGT